MLSTKNVINKLFSYIQVLYFWRLALSSGILFQVKISDLKRERNHSTIFFLNFLLDYCAFFHEKRYLIEK